MEPTSSTQTNEPSDGTEVNASALAGEFESLPDDYQNVVRLAQQQHGIRVVPLQALKGGFTGAALYLVSVSPIGTEKVEHLVLKLDRPWPGEPDELDRHRRALKQSPPDFVQAHVAEVAFDRIELDGSIAIFYGIAGESLHEYRPLGAFQRQNQLDAIFGAMNRDLLTRWNANAHVDKPVHPRSLLSRWLSYRLEPKGSIESFLQEVCQIDAAKPGFLINGRAYPNPLLFAREEGSWGDARRVDAVTGLQHGDLNLNNILARFGEDETDLDDYYLIDLAFFEEGIPLFYDQAYLEMAFLLPYVSTVDFSKWVDLVTSFAEQDIVDPQQVPIEFAGAVAAISAGRREFDRWVRETHPSLTDDMWGQYRLAAVAAGLNHCGKEALSERQRLAGIVFAAAHLKRYCDRFDMPRPVDVALLYDAGRQEDAPLGIGAPAQPKAKHNLPTHLTSFIGREDQIVAVNDLLSKNRLVTLTGSGGSGKTRLAQEVGASNVGTYADGVWFVALAPLSEPELIEEEVASVLEVGEHVLDSYLEDKSLLLILDNCEHLVDSCAQLANTLVQKAPRLTILATSQAALGIPGEAVHSVPTLEVPDSDELPIETLESYEAVRLFVERSAAVQPRFALTAENKASVAQITQRLDGIPLAIELAAARTKVLSPQQISERLDDAFRLLAGGHRTVDPRHRTLLKAIDWSYQLLSDTESVAFGRASVFRGGFTLEATEQVCSGDGLESHAVLDALTQLVDRSLVIVEHAPYGEPRYRMLEVLRLYAAERLAETGDTADVRKRHAGFLLEFAQEVEPKLHGLDQLEWFEKVDLDYDNIRVALGWSIESGDSETALRMGASLSWFWHVHSHVDEGEGSEWLEQAMLAEGDVPDDSRAAGLLAAGFMQFSAHGNLDAAKSRLTESLRLWEELGADEGIAATRGFICLAEWVAGDLEGSARSIEATKPLAARVGNRWLTAWLDLADGAISGVLGRHERAKDMLASSLKEFRGIGDIHGIAWCLNFVGGLGLVQGRYEDARPAFSESREYWTQFGERAPYSASLIGLGTAMWVQGAHNQAIEIYKESLVLLREMGDRGIAVHLIAAAPLALRSQGDVERAVETHRERLRLPIDHWVSAAMSDSLRRLGEAAGRQGDLDRSADLESQSGDVASGMR